MMKKFFSMIVFAGFGMLPMQMLAMNDDEQRGEKERHALVNYYEGEVRKMVDEDVELESQLRMEIERSREDRKRLWDALCNRYYSKSPATRLEIAKDAIGTGICLEDVETIGGKCHTPLTFAALNGFDDIVIAD